VPLAPLGKRVLRIVLLLAVAGLALWAIHTFGLADVERWLDKLWHSFTDVHPAYIVAPA
jgi:hypothetical protein